jgi:hypothetical protein
MSYSGDGAEITAICVPLNLVGHRDPDEAEVLLCAMGALDVIRAAEPETNGSGTIFQQASLLRPMRRCLSVCLALFTYRLAPSIRGNDG